jgi:hypothetical protein
MMHQRNTLRAVERVPAMHQPVAMGSNDPRNGRRPPDTNVGADRDLCTLGSSPTLHEARAAAWNVSRRRLAHQERRLRRRSGQLDAGQLTRWYAVRQVLRERGRNVPPVTRGLP